MAVNSRHRPALKRVGFTLIEMLVVVGIISVLTAILVPAITGARASAQRIKCAGNLRSIGQSVFMFARDHHDRVPEGQDTPKSGAGSWVPTWMYTKDYFVMVDSYGANQALFICPSSPLAEKGPSGFSYGEGSESAARVSADLLPENPETVAQGEEDLSIYWMATSYIWLGRNVQETFAPAGNNPDGAPFEVTKLSKRTFTGDASDVNPPLMADTAIYYTNGVSQFTHGRRWQIETLDTGTSVQPWYRGTASSQQGDIRINVLYIDGHVDCKAPDQHAFFNVGNAYYFH